MISRGGVRPSPVIPVRLSEAADEFSARMRSKASENAETIRKEVSNRRENTAAIAAPRGSTIPKPRLRSGFNQAVGLPPSIEMRHPSELRVDDSYQRSIDTGPSRKLIAGMARDWDWRLCVPLMVSRREDGLYVIDGQHRLAAANMRGDIPFLPCCISTYDGPADEARMFVAANRSRRAVNHLDDFHAAIVANNDDAIEINNLVVGAGLRVSRKTGKTSWIPGEVTFTAAIARVLRRHGEGVVSWSLRLIAEEFKGQVLSNGSSVFTALCMLRIAPPDDALDEARLRAALRAYDMQGWGTFLNGCKGGDDRRRAMREAILMAYADAPEAERENRLDE